MSSLSFDTDHQKYVKILVKGAIVTLIGRGLGSVINVLVQVVLARSFGPATFGLYAIGWTILRMIGNISPIGLDHGVIRFGSQVWEKDNLALKGILQQCFSLAGVSGIILTALSYFLAPTIANDIFHKPELQIIIRLFSPAFFFYALLKVTAAATQITKRMQYIYSVDLFQPLTNLLLIGLFLWLGYRLHGMVVAATISFILATIISIYFVSKLFKDAFSHSGKPSLQIMKILSFSLPTSLASIFTMFIVWIDRLMVGYFMPSEDMGIYQAASQSAILFILISSAFVTIFSPIIVELYHKGEMKKLNDLYKISTKWGIYLCLPLCLVILLLPGEFISLVFGENYSNSSLPIVFLTLGQLFNVARGGTGLLLVMTGKQKVWFTSSSVMLLLNTVLCWLFIPRWGLAGGASATFFSLMGLFFIGVYQVHKHHHIMPFDRRFIKGFIAALFSVGVILLVDRLIESSSIVVIVSLILSPMIFVFALALLGFDGEDKDAFIMVKRKLMSGVKSPA